MEYVFSPNAQGRRWRGVKNPGMRFRRQPPHSTENAPDVVPATVSRVDTVHVSISVNKTHEITLVYLADQDDSTRYIHSADVYNNPKIYLYVLFCTRLTLGDSSWALATPLLFAKNTFIIHQKWGTRVIKTNRAADPLPPAITALTLHPLCPKPTPSSSSTTTTTHRNNGPHITYIRADGRARFKICNFYDFCYWSKLFSLFVTRTGPLTGISRRGELFCVEKRALVFFHDEASTWKSSFT